MNNLGRPRVEKGQSPDGREEIDVYTNNKHPDDGRKSTLEVRNFYGKEDGYSLERKRELRREADEYLRDNGII